MMPELVSSFNTLPSPELYNAETMPLFIAQGLVQHFRFNAAFPDPLTAKIIQLSSLTSQQLSTNCRLETETDTVGGLSVVRLIPTATGKTAKLAVFAAFATANDLIFSRPGENTLEDQTNFHALAQPLGTNLPDLAASIKNLFLTNPGTVSIRSYGTQEFTAGRALRLS